MKKTLITLSLLLSTSAFAETLVTCTRKWTSAPAFDRGVMISSCIDRFARNDSLKNCLLSARFIDTNASSFDYQNAAAKCLELKRVRLRSQCDSLNGESDPSDKYNNYYIEDCHYALDSLSAHGQL